jgi:hypothetical protein
MLRRLARRSLDLLAMFIPLNKENGKKGEVGGCCGR